LVEARRWGEAVPPLQRVGRLDPLDGEAAVNLGVALMSLGEDEEAVTAFERAIRSNPGLPQAYLNLAVLHHAQGRRGKAIETLELYAGRNPSEAQALDVPRMIEELRAP
jgi:Flp pilus assembly protein TadD